ncbi:hypothetical protein [Actinomycetospora sp. CA-084318]|uniref:hypothetical protein n=1 Tax=Actinomycetospora sp. CA-084318 TaxID=3239892 RepID=UPI003D97725F
MVVDRPLSFDLPRQRATLEPAGPGVIFSLDAGRAGGSRTTLGVGDIGSSSGPDGRFSFSVTGLDDQGRPVFRLARA